MVSDIQPEQTQSSSNDPYEWIQAACDRHKIRRESGMKIVAKNKLTTQKRELPSGRVGLYVHRAQFDNAVQGVRDQYYRAKRFFWNCVSMDVEPFETLHSALSANFGDEVNRHYDLDFVHAAIRLTLEDSDRFLAFLTERWEFDGTFVSQIASLLGFKEPRCDLSADDEKEAEFLWFWKRIRAGLAYPDESGVEMPHQVVNRDLLNGTRPRYLNLLINCTDIPKWAEESVLPFRRPWDSTTAMAFERINKMASRRPALDAFLRGLAKSVMPQRLVYKAEGTEGKDPEVVNWVYRARDQIVALFEDIDRNLALDYCWALSNRVNHDTAIFIRRTKTDAWRVSNKGHFVWPVAMVNRIFCLGRGAKIDVDVN